MTPRVLILLWRLRSHGARKRLRLGKDFIRFVVWGSDVDGSLAGRTGMGGRELTLKVTAGIQRKGPP